MCDVISVSHTWAWPVSGHCAGQGTQGQDPHISNLSSDCECHAYSDNETRPLDLPIVNNILSWLLAENAAICTMMVSARA